MTPVDSEGNDVSAEPARRRLSGRSKRLMTVGGALILGAGLGAAIASGLGHQDPSDGRNSEDAGRENEESSTDMDHESSSDQLVDGYCDILPAGNGQAAAFAAAIDVNNPRDENVIVEVWAEFSREGSGPVRLSEKVEVAPGDTRPVHLHKEIPADQAAAGRTESSQCEIGGDVVTTDDETSG